MFAKMIQSVKKKTPEARVEQNRLYIENSTFMPRVRKKRKRLKNRLKASAREWNS